MAPPGTDDYRIIASNLASAWEKKYEQTDESEDLTEAISHHRAALTSCPLDHPFRPLYLSNLAGVLMSRFDWSGNLNDVKRMWVLLNLANVYHTRFRQTYDSEDLEKAISQYREVLLLCPPDHEHKDKLLMNLGLSLITRFQNFGRMDYKDIADAIKHYRTSISLMPEGNPEVSSMLSNFARGLSLIFSRTGDAEHLEESIALSRSAVEYPFSSARDRLKAAKNWTVTAHATRHSSALTAYRKALSLLQRAIDLGPTVQTRHEYISGRDIEPLRSLSMDAASYAIKSCAYEEAIEMLEQGRALLWSGMRSLRTPLDHLHEVDKSLADEFTKISQALEAIITTTADTFAHDLAEKRRLSGELDKVVLQIRALPGFENFRRPIPFHHLQAAAIGGPVIIINLSSYRSDILIVRSNHPVVHIPTPTDFFDRVTKLAHQLSETRTPKSYRLESKTYDRVLRRTLEELSELVGQPVANRLMELGIPEQSRIWLCPTSVLASLPIHAAGPLSSHNNVKRYLCDIYVCSYTPSLSALIASRSRNLSGSASGQPSLLIVGQPDESLPGVDSETRSIECLVGGGSVTRIAGKAATPENVIAHLLMHPWVHFACHGMLQPGRPFESSFLLQHNIHLTLLRIAKAHVHTAELAFLAACHTAELTEDGTPDEVLHLTAAMQFSGFRSVIGTMWAMADEDGKDLSEHFYGKMFAADAQAASYEKSAKALRHATQRLRTKKGISLERWVNFVHYGA
ncbi:CHAT domain-containing protein [Lactifluus subvellereus]|nr:CHAT domain-containing protein [Lactifluus subvellereus]